MSAIVHGCLASFSPSLVGKDGTDVLTAIGGHPMNTREPDEADSIEDRGG